MKFLFAVFLVNLIFFVTNVNVIHSQDLQPIPELRERVTDLSGLLSAEEKQELAAKLKAHEEQTTNQIAILIIPTTSPETIEQYSLRVVEKWKLGQKGKNNGVLLLFAMQDRKIRIEVGYGLEGSLPDAKASRIIREVIVPKFKERKFYEGITLGVNAVIDVLSKGDFEAPPSPKEKDQKKTAERDSEFKNFGAFVVVFFIVTYIIFYFLSKFLSIEGLFPSILLFGIISFVGSYILKQNFDESKLITSINMVLFFILEIFRRLSNWGSSGGGGYYYTGGSSSSYSSSSYSSWSGDSFSGGGGDFGGGGASGSWD